MSAQLITFPNSRPVPQVDHARNEGRFISRLLTYLQTELNMKEIDAHKLVCYFPIMVMDGYHQGEDVYQTAERLMNYVNTNY